MILFENIGKNFGKTVALNNINLSFEANHSYALLGPNGSGKTTLIKCLLGMVLPQKGNITFYGNNIRNDYLYRDAIGYMPQIGQYPVNMTIASLFDMMRDLRKMHGMPTDDDLIEAYKLHDIKNKKLGSLSGGTRQKVSACLAFLFNPSVLILDEPTAGLDPLSAEILKEKIRTETNKNKIILITSHILSDLDDIITDVIYLQDGELVFQQAFQDLADATGEERLSRILAHIMLEQNKKEAASAKNN